MPNDQLMSLEEKFEEVGVTSERVSDGALVPAIAEAARTPAVATPFGEIDSALENEGIVVDPTPAEVWDAHTGITEAAFAVGEYGSLFLPQSEDGSELLGIFVDRHVVVLRGAEIVPTMEGAFDRLGEELPLTRESGIIATGPSATADMGELVTGAHGPGSVHVILVREA